MVLTVLKGLGKSYLKSKKGAIKKIAPTLGLKKTEAYKKTLKKTPWQKMGISKKEYDDLPF